MVEEELFLLPTRETLGLAGEGDRATDDRVQRRGPRLHDRPSSHRPRRPGARDRLRGWGARGEKVTRLARRRPRRRLLGGDGAAGEEAERRGPAGGARRVAVRRGIGPAPRGREFRQNPLCALDLLLAGTGGRPEGGAKARGDAGAALRAVGARARRESQRRRGARRQRGPRSSTWDRPAGTPRTPSTTIRIRRPLAQYPCWIATASAP